MDNTIETFNFRIDAIELLEYALNTPTYSLSPDLNYKFDMSIEHKINLDIKKIFVICSFVIRSEIDDFQFAHAKISCVYDVPDVEMYHNEVDKKVKLSESVGVTLNSVSLSTSRGVLFTLFRGTFLHHVILPIVDPKTFIPGNEK